jgi:hypothetical protein
MEFDEEKGSRRQEEESYDENAKRRAQEKS